MSLYNKINKKELKERMARSDEERKTLSFYKYFFINDPASFRDRWYRTLNGLGVMGRIYIASEGINAQISVPVANWNEFVKFVESHPPLKGIRLNIAIEGDGKSFYMLKIVVKKKIVADGLDDELFDVTRSGQHIDAEEYNRISEEANSVVVDMRNHYESEVGRFEGAICPDVETFEQALVEMEKIVGDNPEKPVILYCTGGIRCEKAGAVLRHKGYKNVYQLNGGIIEYARQVKEKSLPNKFRGKNFVFDERLGERISDEIISQCHQCGAASDTHVNCANEACHILFIQCIDCSQKFNGCCSQKCADFIQLPEEERQRLRKTMVFNGSRSGKGRLRM